MINTLNHISKEYESYPLHSVLMFTDAHAHLIQMLEDSTCYRALSEITGKHLAVFHTRLFHGRHEMPSPPPGIFCFMVPIWKEPNENKKLLVLFDMKDSRSLPSLVTFCFSDGTIHYAEASIATESPQIAFNSLVNITQRLVRVANSSDDRLEAMRKAKFEMRALKIKKGIGDFVNLLGLFRGASGI